MSAAAMLTVPVLMKPIEKTTTLIKNPWLKAPCMVLLSGLMLSISTPFCCALFPQRAEIPLTKLEPNLQEVCYSHTHVLSCACIAHIFTHVIFGVIHFLIACQVKVPRTHLLFL